MIVSADVANRLQPTGDSALRSALPTQELTDKLSGLVAGQRLLAEIQALLPNGAYRALINQRSVTLALPFAAKTGDAIELEVTESDGKLTLAVVATTTADGKPVGESSPTHLSRAGQLIGQLLAGSRDAKNGPVALPLNDNQPIAAKPPTSGQDLLPLLQQAIKQSGMFYEAHQAEWVEGRYSTAELRQEPQGKLVARTGTPPLPGPPPPAAETPSEIPLEGRPESRPENRPENRLETASVSPQRETATAITGAAPHPTRAETAPASPAPLPHGGGPATPGNPPTPAVAPQVEAIVQQQLESFATQNFSWQGQIWPGQQMQWDIQNDSTRRESADSPAEEGEKWQTRLRLTLPKLGEVEARLYIRDQQIALSLFAADIETREKLRGGGMDLRDQLEKAGLGLATIGVSAPL